MPLIDGGDAVDWWGGWVGGMKEGRGGEGWEGRGYGYGIGEKKKKGRRMHIS